MLSPNPLILSKSESNFYKGVVTLTNTSEKLLLFTVFFDANLFCGISPACGEIEPQQSIKLTSLFDKIPNTDEEVTFMVRYTLVRPTIDPNTKTELMLNPTDWAGKLQSNIRFSSHAEDALNSFSHIMKDRPSFSQAVKKSSSRNFEQGQKDSIVKKLIEKQQQKQILQEKINNLRTQIEECDRKMSTLVIPHINGSNLLMVGFIVFVLALLINKFRKN